MANIMYRQCTFERPGADGGVIHTTGWIPESKKGIKIRPGVQVTLDDSDDWWTVITVGSRAMPLDVVKEKERDYQKHRKATDI